RRKCDLHLYLTKKTHAVLFCDHDFRLHKATRMPKHSTNNPDHPLFNCSEEHNKKLASKTATHVWPCLSTAFLSSGFCWRLVIMAKYPARPRLGWALGTDPDTDHSRRGRL